MTIGRFHTRTEDGRIVFPFEAVKVEFLLLCSPSPSITLGETTSHSTRLQTTTAKSLVIPQGEREVACLLSPLAGGRPGERGKYGEFHNAEWPRHES
jgi:hypothetical protein